MRTVCGEEVEDQLYRQDVRITIPDEMEDGEEEEEADPIVTASAAGDSISSNSRRSRSPPRSDDTSRRPRLKLSKRTLPVREIKKTVTLGEAFGKKTTSTKPKSNPFGNAKPVVVGMRNLKEKLLKTEKKVTSSPFGNAKPVDTTTKTFQAKKKSNPFGDATPTRTRDPFTSTSEKEKNVDKENQQEDTTTPVSEEPKLPIRAKSPPVVTEEVVEDDDEGEWQTRIEKEG